MSLLFLLLMQQIVRPVDRASLAAGPVEVLAKAPPGARLELDGKALEPLAPFPGVIQAKAFAAPGRHRLALIWDGGHQEIEIAVGAAEGFAPYRPHPPGGATACGQCHGVSARGRFRFEGGCFTCHAAGGFARSHTHDAHRLAECGACHNAHGSTAARHLLRPREKACQLCHQ